MAEATVEQVREIIAQCKERISNYTNEIDKITKDIKEHKDAGNKDKVNELDEQLKDLQAKRSDDQKRQTLAEEQLTRLTDNSTSAKSDDNSQDRDKPYSKDYSEPTTATTTVTQGDRDKNAKLAAQHPERVVDGIYYADDKALKAAKEAQEKRIQAETAQATTEAQAKAAKLAAAMKAINETLYGTDNTEVLTQLQGSVGGAELSSVLGNAVSVRKRQRLLDFNNFKSDFKEPNSGKPPHNKDPFPVDLKIEEFETHQPRVKVHEITTHNHGKAAAIMGIMQFDATERRLVRLENNMATMLRYLYRLGSRVFINCQFYGGQTTFEKYKCIRCMKDDRCGDGQMMQIDQCLCCTRYEPIFGQVYEIMNDIGVNVAQVLDDLQCSYMNNEEYVRMSRIEEYNNSPKQGKFDLTKVLRDQGTDSQGFDYMWGNGIRMNWTLVPVEDQKPHINWRQAIDDDGSGLNRLASWFDPNSGLTATITDAVNNPEKVNLYLKNQQAMEQNAGNETYSEYIKKGKEFTENTIDQARTDWENNELLITKAIGSGSDIDKYAVLAAAVALGESDYEKVVNDYRNVSTRIDSTNPALIWTAMGSSETIIKMYVDGTLESYVSAGQEKDENGNVKKTTNVPAKANLIPEPTIIPSPFASHFERIGAPLNTRPYDRFAIHHTAGTYDASMQAIHEAGLGANDCRGFNYTYAIYSDGSIHEGRPEKYLGSHTGNLTAAERARGIIGNAGRIGITFPGNFNSTELTQTQLDACISLIAYKCKQYNITPTRKTIMGHYEVYGDAPNPSSWSGCPGTNVGKHLDDIVNAVASGHLTGSATTLWVDFIELVIKGLQKDGKTSLDGLDLFPKICYMYVKLMADTKNSSFDSDQGWGFPFTNEIINSQKSEKCVFLTGKYREQRSDHLHEGIDLQVGDNYNHPKTDVPFCAVKDGTVYTEGQWCNAIYVKHNDGTFSRYLHCRRHLKKQGDTVRKGEQLGIVGGMDNSGQESYAVHLHLEIGKVIEGKTPLERTVGDDCGINPLDCFKPPNSDSGGVPMWTVV